MNNQQKIVQQQFLDNEQEIIKRLNNMYQDSLRDIEKTIKAQYADIQRLTDAINDLDPNDPQRAILESQRRSKVYQKQYQESLKKQVSEILDKMNTKQYLSVSDYLNDCYTNGFVGAMYDLHGQGIPLMLPIDQQAMVRAVQLDSKISKGLYTKMGIDVGDLKNRITSTVSRAMATGLSFERCAKDLANQTKIGFNKAVRIARTEGHRIQTTATMDAMTAAKDNGADVLKQWDATLDGNTRESHAMVDGEIRELHQKFSNGLDYPGSGGKASEVVNCRCALLQRARWALDDAELKTLQERAKYFGLDKTQNFDDFKQKYLKAAEGSQNSTFTMAKTIAEAEQQARNMGVKYVDYGKLPLDTANDMNKALATLPEGMRPVFAGDSRGLEKSFYGNDGKLPRKHNSFYGVSMDGSAYGIYVKGADGRYHLDLNGGGQMVGISSIHNTAQKISISKSLTQETYRSKYGRNWFFNETGETTAMHEIGHVYANINGLPNGFARAAAAWAEESKCDMLKNPTEAWAEAWASYHTGINVDKIPSDVLEFIKKASGKQ